MFALDYCVKSVENIPTKSQVRIERKTVYLEKSTHTHTAIKFYTRNNMKHAHGKRKNRVFIKIGKVKTTETVQPGIHGHLNRRFNTSKHLEAFALRSVGYK